MPRPPAKTNKSKLKTKASVPAARPQFLTIALELREIIYKHVLYDAPSSLTDLLVVNHQLSSEVLPFQFKRHLTFDGQRELFDWLDEVDHRYLHHVVDIKFKLHDIDPEMIVGALGKRLRQANITAVRSSNAASSNSNPYYEACDAEMKKIGEAFRLIPNVGKFTIATTDAGDPQPPHRMLSMFSKIVAHRFPLLHTLISYEDAMPVDFISNKPRLQRLRFPAISTSSNTHVAEVFSTLPSLDLEIYRLPHHTPPTTPKRRILAQVLRSLRPVRSLLLYDSEAESDEPDLTYEVFVHCRDPFSKHKVSLRSFTYLTDSDENVDDTDDDWMVESRTALRRFLRDASQQVEIVGLDAGTWSDPEAP